MPRPRLAPSFTAGATLACAAVMCAAPAMATPLPTPSGSSLLPSTAVFQTPTCGTNGAHVVFVTLTNGSTVTQTFNFTTPGSQAITPAGAPVIPGGTSGVSLTAPAAATAIYVTAGGAPVGSISLPACASTKTSPSASTSPRRTTQPTAPAPRASASTAAPTAPASTSTTSAAPSTTSEAGAPSASPTAGTTSQAPRTSASAPPPASSGPSSTSPSSSTSNASSPSSSAGSTAATPPVVPPPLSAEPVAAGKASTSSTNPLYVAGGVAVGVLGLALAAVALRREFKNN